MTNVPAVREMPREECDKLLAENHIGRIAFSYRDQVDIAPIGYVYANGWIYARTSLGAKLRTLAHNRWVAFQTDQFVGMFEWKSVVVKGALYRLEKNGVHAEAYDQALTLLRTLIPHTLEPDDPAPERTELFRIHADHVTGRAASPHR